MSMVKIRYFVEKKNKSGTSRFYWQPDQALRDAGWTPVRLADNRHDAIAQAEGINRHLDEWRAGREAQPADGAPGTVYALIRSYKKSRFFLKLAKKTQKDYVNCLEVIREWAGDAPLQVISAKMVQNFYDDLRATGKTRKADYVIQVLRRLFSYAENESLIPKGANPAARPGLEYRAAKQKIWPAAAITHFVKTADRMGLHQIGTAVMLNEWIGQRRGDLLALRSANIKDGMIDTITQNKTGAQVAGLDITIIPELKARIDAQLAMNVNKGENARLIQQTGSGLPFADDWFAKCFAAVRDEAARDMPDMAALKFQTLRHTAVTRLAEAGCTPQEIASITGHAIKNCEDIIDRYNTRTAKTARNALIKRYKSETAEGTNQ